MAASRKNNPARGRSGPLSNTIFVSSPSAPSRHRMGSLRSRMLCWSTFSHCLPADLRPIAASHHVGHPVLHLEGKLRPLILPAVCSYRLSRVFETVAVKAMMHGNPVERFDPHEFGKLVNQARCKQDFRSTAGGAVGTDKLEPIASGEDARYRRPAHRDRLEAAEFLPRLIQKLGRRMPFLSQKTVDCVRAQIALMPCVAEQYFAEAPSRMRAALSPAGPPPTMRTSNCIRKSFGGLGI